MTLRLRRVLQRVRGRRRSLLGEGAQHRSLTGVSLLLVLPFSLPLCFWYSKLSTMDGMDLCFWLRQSLGRSGQFRDAYLLSGAGLRLTGVETS